MELKLCSGNQIANGRTDRWTDARRYNITCQKFFRAYKNETKFRKERGDKIKIEEYRSISKNATQSFKESQVQTIGSNTI
jgi:kynurenine formamidase